MDIDSFIIDIKAKGLFKDIAADVKKKYDTWNEVDRQLPKGINKKDYKIICCY